jgi:hypothetical protein
MLTSSLDTIREEKAKFARNVEYLRETALDDIIDTRVELAESRYVRETIEELEEAVSMVDRLPSEEDVMEESVEVERILNADTDITFNELIGIE